MRPLKLSITAFGPYANTQLIDFRELGGRSFFLIHGSTGAGKTTILDAMCYALYGETSGDERKGEQMRSQHAKPSLLTRVEFEFALGQDVYCAIRQPKQEKPSERGDKMVSVQQKATLTRRTEGDNPLGNDIPIASTWRDVTEKIEELFGFESEQFRQVIMLPQDRFRQLLRASSDEREEIFKTLFQTERFERTALALKAESKSLEDEIRSLRGKRDLLLGQAHVSSSQELVELQRLTQDDLEHMRLELASLRKDETIVQESLKRGEEDARKIAEKTDAEVGLRGLELKQREFVEKRYALDSARKASVLVEVEGGLLRNVSSV